MNSKGRINIWLYYKEQFSSFKLKAEMNFQLKFQPVHERLKGRQWGALAPVELSKHVFATLAIPKARFNNFKMS
jgi:hypothetical protein